MGNMTELVLQGVLCEYCGGFIDGEEVGYSRQCDICDDDLNEEKALTAMRAKENISKRSIPK